MGTTLTIRTDPDLREALEKKAAAQGKSLSRLVREILEDALVERPLEERISQLKGSLELPRKSTDSWRQEIRERNWRS